MTFRADEIAAEMREAELEREIAELEGRALGLEVAIAEAEDRIASAAKRAARLIARAGRKAWAALGLACGFLVGSTCSGGVPMAIGFAGLGDCSAIDVDERLHTAGGECTVTVAGEDSAGCRARFVCGGETLYDGTGECGSFYGQDDRVEYWDHSTADGTPALVVAEHDRVVAWRDVSGATRRHDLAR